MNITIDCDKYIDLLLSQYKLRCLEAGGVDNWDWYDESLSEKDSNGYDYYDISDWDSEKILEYLG